MVGGDFKAFSRDEEKDIVVFTLDFNIGFISCVDVINRAFSLEVE